MTRKVVCAAIRAADQEVLIGVRHYDVLMRRQISMRTDGHKFMHLLDEDQGFVDQDGNFMSREEAYEVATIAGQDIDDHKCGVGLNGMKLYSEGLY